MENTTDIMVTLPLQLLNPLVVRNSKWQIIGGAVAVIEPGNIHLRFLLDPNTPEAMDLAIEPERCKVRLAATLVNGVLTGEVYLDP